MQCPDGLLYTTEHEWIRIDDGLGTVGITDFAQHELGDVVFVELPAVGTAVTKGQAFAVVESVKAVSDIYAPMSGEVTEVNDQLGPKPELVNQDPYGKGWIMRMEILQPEELKALLSAKDYQNSLGEES